MNDTEDLKQNSILYELETPLIDEQNEIVLATLLPTNQETNAIPQQQHQEQNTCQDSIYAIIFLINFLSILFIVFEYGVPAIQKINQEHNDNEHYKHYTDYIKLSILSCIVSFLITSIFKIIFISLSLKLTSSESDDNFDKSMIIKYALGYTTITSLLLSILFQRLLNEFYLSLISLLFFIFSISYGCIIQSQMSFSSINVAIAIRAIRSNRGLAITAHGILVLGIFYIMYWCIAMIGLYEDSKVHCEKQYKEDVICSDSTPKDVHVLLLFFNFYWAQQVIKNIIHVVVAGTLKQWWYTNNDQRQSFKTVSDSLFNAMTLNFGSICLGSLLVTIVHILHILLNYIQEDDTILCCSCNCLLNSFQSIYKKFNKWGYVYVGIHGYDFTTSSHLAINLIYRRGWDMIIDSDHDLITNIFGLVICIVGLSNGAMSLILLDYVKDWFFFDETSWRYVIFTTGFMIGVVISSIMLGIIESAVNTIVVLFAEAPNEFDANHTLLSQQLRNTWREAYPGIC